MQPRSEISWKSTEEGNEILTLGSPEFRVMTQVQARSLTSITESKRDATLARGVGECIKLGWLIKDSEGNLSPRKDFIGEDIAQTTLKQFLSNPTDELAVSLLRRKWVSKIINSSFDIAKGECFTTELVYLTSDLTKTMIQNNHWKTAHFKPYNFKSYGAPIAFGSIHPLMETLCLFRNVLVNMGFIEMDTRRWVESSFWNFDAMFQPQTHPVRDMQDTFYLSSPEYSLDNTALKQLDKAKGTDHCKQQSADYVARVKSVHEVGGYGSLGWNYSWDESESRKLILRTHTTAVTTKLLRSFALEYQNNPKLELEFKLFSIDRVFRNETLDATHLAEFHQVEGVVVSCNASLRMLMETIRTFYKQIGIDQIKFKPAYNPYTEPSMEIFGFHPILKKWTELGNSGIFRPEMLQPMGLPENLVVLGWGLSLERPTMISHGVTDIRTLFGSKSKLEVI